MGTEIWMTRKRMFCSYLYGYLNTYYANRILSQCSDGTYKREKVRLAGNYLKLSGKSLSLFTASFGLWSCAENVLYIFIVTYYLLKVLLTKVRRNKSQQVNKAKDIFVYGYGAWNLFTLIKKTEINIDDVVVITYPCRDNSSYDQRRRFDLSQDLTVAEIFQAYGCALRMIFFIKHKYGSRDALFHTSNSFEYFSVYLFYLKHPDYKICFVDLYDRWAYMFGSLKNYKILIQHGMITRGSLFIKKTGDVDECYAFSEEQKEILLETLIKTIKICRYLPKLSLYTLSDTQSGRRTLLIICSHFFYDKEKQIVEKLSLSKKWDLYLKPHPLDDIAPYTTLASTYNAVLVGKEEFPKVDLAISYASTLALEYQIAGVKVLQYNDSDFEEELQKLY